MYPTKAKQVSNTRIFLDCDALLDELLDVTPGFPRDHKYTIGSKMQELAVDLIREISAAFRNRDKQVRADHLDQFLADFDTLKVLVRKAGKRKWIHGLSRYANIIELMDGIGKQANAWKNSLTKGTEGCPDNEYRPEPESQG